MPIAVPPTGLGTNYDLSGANRPETVDLFGRSRTDGGPVIRFEAITPHASINFPGGVARGFYVGVSGDVALVGTDDAVVVFKGAAVGYHPVMCKRVNAINTTATNLVALF